MALVGATILAFLASLLAMNIAMYEFNKEYPRDGQNGLGAMMVGVMVAILVEIVSGIGLFVLQRKMTSTKRRV